MREEQHEESQFAKALFGGGGNGRNVRPHSPRSE